MGLIWIKLVGRHWLSQVVRELARTGESAAETSVCLDGSKGAEEREGGVWEKRMLLLVEDSMLECYRCWLFEWEDRGRNWAIEHCTYAETSRDFITQLHCRMPSFHRARPVEISKFACL